VVGRAVAGFILRGGDGVRSGFGDIAGAALDGLENRSLVLSGWVRGELIPVMGGLRLAEPGLENRDFCPFVVKFFWARFGVLERCCCCFREAGVLRFGGRDWTGGRETRGGWETGGRETRGG